MEGITLQVTGDGSHTLFVPALNETYHSHHGALQESAHVFIAHGLQYVAGLAAPQAAQQANQPPGATSLRVFEVGFGTGLNALLALQAAGNNQLQVFYTSLEPYPVPPELVKQLNYPTLLNKPELQQHFNSLHAAPWGEAARITPSFTLNKLQTMLANYQRVDTEALYDVAFFDAFAPNKQAELWQPAALQVVFDALRPGGVLTTYCAQGQFRRNLAQVGFEVAKIPGPPGKREMVRAVKPAK